MTRLGRTVGQQVRRHRLAQGLSAQGLSDICSELNFAIPRNVISNIENGRKTNVSLAELMILGEALKVPPFLLLFPPTGEPVEYIPGKYSDILSVMDWLDGRAPSPFDREFHPSYQFNPSRNALELLRRHRSMVRQVNRLYRAAWDEEISPDEEGPTPKALRDMARDDEKRLFKMRKLMLSKGIALPELPPHLRDREASYVEEHPQATLFGDYGEDNPPF